MSNPKSTIQSLSSQIVALAKQERDILEGIEVVLQAHYGVDRLKQIKANLAQSAKERKGLEEKLKEAARAKAEVGENVIVFENESIKVSVSGTKPKISYNSEMALEKWPEELADDVLTYSVDAERLQHRIELGLPAETLALVMAARIEEEQTAKVKIELIVAEAAAPASDVAPIIPIRRKTA
jgi:hypothetical protein